MKKIVLLAAAILCINKSVGQSTASPEQFGAEERPWLWWYWMGSPVTEKGIDAHLDKFRAMGYGGMSIAATYGVKGYEDREIPFMSERWVEKINYTASGAQRRGMGVDVSLTSAWPFGGPNVTPDMAARYSTGGRLFSARGGDRTERKVFDPQRMELSALSAYSEQGGYLDLTGCVAPDGILRYAFPDGAWEVYGIFCAPTRQTTKRSGRGGEGLVLDHFNKASVEKYLLRYDSLFLKGAHIRGTFNDSYEVYGADYTPVFLEEFYTRRGYRLEEHLDKLFSSVPDEAYARVLCDYRETISDLLFDSFVNTWAAWARRHGVKTVEQAHGSPANWLDLYAAADIPETESFGASPLFIPGVRMDELYNEKAFGRPDPSVLKFASSAAHVAGKKYTASESATWLGDHFKVALSQVKPQIDELFTCGINHIMLTCGAYSPEEAPFPGWRFYPAADFGTNNAFVDYMPDFSTYVARCQKLLQEGRPDNDVLLYFPVHDMWSELRDEDGRSKLVMFTVHNPDNWFYKNDFGLIARTLRRNGYDFDYVSDRQIAALGVENGSLKTAAGATYKTIVIPSCRRIPLETMRKFATLAEAGIHIVFAYRMPQDVPGYGNLDRRRAEMTRLVGEMRKMSTVRTTGDYVGALKDNGIRREGFGACELQFIRRRNDRGTVYFTANLSNVFSEGWVGLSTRADGAVIYDPMTGTRGKARTDGNKVYLQMAPGESRFIELYNQGVAADWNYFEPSMSCSLDGDWKVTFLEGGPQVPEPFVMRGVKSWTTAPDTMARYFSGTGRYETRFDVPASIRKQPRYRLSLGDVREVADVWVNDVYVGRSWAVPFEVAVDPRILKSKGNTLRIEVRNLDANRISWMDRNRIEWKTYFIVDVSYANFDASRWLPVPSGLLGPVILKSSKRPLKI